MPHSVARCRPWFVESADGGGSDQGEGVGIGEQRFQVLVIEQFDDGEIDAHAAAKQFVAVARRLPVLALVGQQGEAGDGAANMVGRGKY